LKGKEKISTEELFYGKVCEALQTRESIVLTILQKVNAINSEGREYKIDKKRVGRIFQSNERIIVNVEKAGEFWMKEGTVTYREKVGIQKIRATMKKILEVLETKIEN